MRVIILSCNTGEGHNATSKAIQEVMSDHDADCEIVDAMACLSRKFSRFLSNWHTRLYKYGPRLMNAGYRAAERSDIEPGETTPVYDLLAYGAKKLHVLLSDGQYDAVLCTHPFAAMMLTAVRKVYACTIPGYFVATDYTCSPGVEQCDLDGYFIPSENLLDEFAEAGLPRERLIISGLPVGQAFYCTADQQIVRRRLNLPQEGKIILLMGGSMGCGPIREIVENLTKLLPPEGFLVAICGNNEKLYEELQNLKNPRLRAIGFSSEVPAYMDAADMIVTKPGGLSSTEAANKHLPIVFMNSVGGCEGRNFDFYLANGYAIGSSDSTEVTEQTLLLLKNPRQCARMRRILQDDFHTNSAEMIARYVLEAIRGI